jgi:outer membrane immunogenic protein
MKKLIIALTAVAAFTGSASAADLAARPYTKAPMMAPVYNWTGFYIFGGAGGGLWDADSNVVSTVPPLGAISDPNIGFEGREKLKTSYAAGARIGYLVAPSVLSYVNAGYSGSQWSGASLTSLFAGVPGVVTTPSFHRDGWFIGGGVENNLDFFGISAPGWFMKTEYRAAYYDRITLPETFAGAPLGTAVTFKPLVQTISTSLVYRFNWGGPLVAKY